MSEAIVIQTEAVPVSTSPEVEEKRALNAMVNVANGLAEFGDALRNIRDQRLFEEAGHKTFTDYVEKRIGVTYRRADQLIQAATVLHNVIDMTGSVHVDFPITETQLRPLCTLLPSEQRTVWEIAIETAPVNPLNGKKVITGPHIEATKREIFSPAASSIEPSEPVSPVEEVETDEPRKRTRNLHILQPGDNEEEWEKVSKRGQSTNRD
jgi:hypothetical protein